MAVFAPGDTGVGDSQIPDGWIRFPDGSIGPPNQPSPIDQAWPTRVPQAPGAPTPGGGVTPGGAPTPVPGASLNTTGPAGPPATTGPQIFPPNKGINPTRQVGPFTGGTSTENSFDPRTWFKADPNATFKAGSPMNGPGGPAAGGFNPLSVLGGGNPYWRGAIAAGGVLTPTPLQDATGVEAPRTLGRSPSGPNNLFFQQPDHPSTMRFPGWPTPPAPAATTPPAATINPNTDTSPYVQPSRPVTRTPGPATPGPINGKINPASVNLGNNPWVTMTRPNMSPQNSAANTQGAPQMGMLDLSSIFNHPAVAAQAAAHPAVQGAMAKQVPDLAQRVPLQNTPLPPQRPPGFGIPFLGELGGQGTST